VVDREAAVRRIFRSGALRRRPRLARGLWSQGARAVTRPSPACPPARHPRRPLRDASRFEKAAQQLLDMLQIDRLGQVMVEAGDP